MMNETGIQRLIQTECTSKTIRLWRNTQGQAWVGNVTHCANGDVLIKNPVRITFGLGVGSSDLIGLKSIIIRPEMVGMTKAIFAGIEVKSATGRVTDEQDSYIKMLWSMGALAGVARSVEDARRILQD